MWKALWNPQEVPQVEHIEGLLDWADQVRWNIDTPRLTGNELRRIVMANKKRAAGIDAWAPRHWSLLPLGFYEALAAVWNCILHNGGDLPQAWLDVRVVLIPKADSDELRPCQYACWLGGPA